VQGVGFRPAVHKLARRLALAGSVRNSADGAEIVVEGQERAVEEFELLLPAALPKLARLVEVKVTTVEPTGTRDFVVTKSATGKRKRALIPPDARLCDACRADMEDLENRRYRYAFTTCTECGPRFSLVEALPYDRVRTSMAAFALCEQCEAEYTDLGDRRYHAEPVCCPECGPALRLISLPGGEVISGTSALALARGGLASGRIVLVKGLGGYQLACRADNSQVIARLRGLKARPTQPFAVMVRDLEVARSVVELCEVDQELLVSAPSPILLAPRMPGTALAPNVAPGLTDVGVMLPTTPLHVELFRDAPYDALVMTSGNARHEPIARLDGDALTDLAGFADLALMHEREVVRRVDDSVARTGEGAPYLVRRSRGYVPGSLPLPCATPVPVLALGGHLQVTACLGVGSEAILSQHVGDLDTCTARDFLEEVALQLEQFLEARSELIVIDAHPDYASTWFGERLSQERHVPILRIQHHLAHAAAVLAEHGAFPRSADEHVASLVLDGTGLGEDGTTWGAEWLTLNGDLAWSRVATGEALTLVGGESAVREPWRVATAALIQAGEGDLLSHLRPEWAPNVADIRPLLTGFQWPRAHGAGRLFEAAGALFGLCDSNSWEGEAAARFESLADSADSEGAPWSELQITTSSCELPSAALLVAAARRLRGGRDPAETALGFHRTFAALAAELSLRVFDSGTGFVALGGGCLVNRHLRRYLTREHRARGLDVLLPRDVPAGDGGLAYGQAALAAAALHRNVRPVYVRPNYARPNHEGGV